MDEQRWQLIQELFHQGALLEGLERERFLQQACGGDAAMYTELRSMLATDSRQEHFILDHDLDEVAGQLLDEPGSDITAREFGPYRLKHLLGEGGMGVVWLAQRTDAGNLVAIKFLPHAGLSPARQDRFAQEIKTLARLRHLYIARLYDAGTLSDRTPWFVMEYVDGVPFLDYCQAPNRTLEEKLHLFRQVCEAVQYAHGQEIVHRDLKPSNILVAADGTPRLLDFGIAREMHQMEDFTGHTQSALRFFSRNYSAPEWITEGIFGIGIDVYSLGVILYQMLTGQLPEINTHRDGDQLVEKPSKVASGRGVNRSNLLSPAAWSELDVICLTAMRHDPAKRYRSVEALLRDLDHYRKFEPLEARPDSLLYRVNRYFRRNRTAISAVSVAIVFLAAMTVFVTVRLARARDEALSEAARARRIQQFMLTLIGTSDGKAAPADDLRVKTVLDHGAQEAAYLSSDPEAQSDLYENLGNMYDMLGEYSRAQQLLQLALDRRRAARPNDARTAEIFTQMGVVKADAAQDAAQFKEAESYAQQGIDLASRHLPANDLHVLSSRAALGRIVAESGDSQQAITMLTPIVARQPDGSSADYTLSDSLSTMIGAEYNSGNISESESFTSRALSLDARLFGPNHPQIAVDLVDEGLNKAAVSHYAEAEPYYRKAISIDKAWYGPNHPDLADFESFLARALREEGKLDEAEDLLQNALKIQETAYGGSNAHSIVTLDTLGEIELDRNRLQNAEADYARCVAISNAIMGQNNYETGTVSADLGEVYRREKQYSRALALLSPAVKVLETTLPPGSFNTAIAQRSLGLTQLALHNHHDAERNLSLAYTVYTKQEHPPAAELAELREALDQSRKSASSGH